MMFKKLFSNEKGVSPVIGVMLMIVVTVILAAAVSSFSTGVENQEAAPQGTFAVTCDESDDLVTIDHLGGDIIYKEDLTLEVSHGSTGGYVNMSNVTFSPNSAYLAPGDVASITVLDKKASTDPDDPWAPWVYTPGVGVSFTGDEISLSSAIGDSVQLTMIDKESGQIIYSSKVTVEP